MNKIFFFLISALSASAVFAADTASTPASKQPIAQHQKMMACGREAKGKTGDEYKAFMKDCLSKKTDSKSAPGPAQAAQRERVRACNKEATWKKGDERKAFLKGCLSKKSE